MAILSTGFGKGMIFIVFAMAKEDINLCSSQACMITILPLKSIIGDQISEMLLLICTAMDLTTETVNLL